MVLYQQIPRGHRLRTVGEPHDLNRVIRHAIAILIGDAIVPGITDDSMHRRVGSGELHCMPRCREGECVLMVTLGIGRTMRLHAMNESMFGKIVLKSNQVVLAKLIHTHHHHQLGRRLRVTRTETTA